MPAIQIKIESKVNHRVQQVVASLAGARTVSVRSAFGGESSRRVFKIQPLPTAANRDGSRAGHFKLTHCRSMLI
jgi:hypothetical protein